MGEHKMGAVKYANDNYSIIESPCVLYREKSLVENIKSFMKAMRDNWCGNTVIGFSVKTAPIPALISVANEHGCMAEVVSDDEYLLAEQVNTPSERIIFNGPIKSRDMLFHAFDNGSIVNLDSMREVRWTKEYIHSHRAIPCVGLRFNFDLEGVVPGSSPAGSEGGRFGFCVEDGSLAQTISELREEGLEVSGLHGHFSNTSHSPEVYAAIARVMCQIKRDNQLHEIKYLDLGGGFYGGGSSSNLYEEYARAVSSILEREFNSSEVTLIIEPGGSILATAASYFGRVIDVKTIRGTVFVVTELSKLNLNSTVFGRRSYSIRRTESRGAAIAKHQVICGYTCMEMDRLVDVYDEPLFEEGDLIEVINAGAYTVSFSPHFFIHARPKLYIETMDDSIESICWAFES